MKKVSALFSLFLLMLAIGVFQPVRAQSPEKFSYQAVIRDNINQLVLNQPIGMRISIVQGSAIGSAVYVETQTPVSNANGLISIEVGSGNVVSGNFSTIDWTVGPYFIKTEADPAGGTNYTITGLSQLISVPYAMHANTAETVTGVITETDPVFGASTAAGITVADTAGWNAKLDTETDPSFNVWDKTTGITITESQITNLQNYLLTEVDPVFNASVAAGITGADTAGWNAKLDNETDPVFTAWDKSTGISITESQISNLQPYLLTETDPVFTASVAAGITGTDTANWNQKLDHYTETQDLADVLLLGNNANATQIKNLADPTDSQDAVTKVYVDNKTITQGTAIGEMLFWNGNEWVALAAGTHGQTLTLCNGVPTWGPCPYPPSQPSPINGPLDPCENSSGNIYNVIQDSGITYTWTVPSGWSIIGGQGTHEITVTSGTTSGTIEVTPSNPVGNGPSQTFAVVIQTIPLTPTAGTHVPYTDEIEWHWNTVSGASGYKWNTTNDYASAVDMGTFATHTETGLMCAPCGGMPYTRYVWAYNTCGSSSALTLTASTTTCPTAVVDVTNPTTGRTWMDRNLGAAQVATSSNDSLAYGDLYQWGRLADGHQCRTSAITATLSTSDVPGHGDFVMAPNNPTDWRTPQNANLWQGVNGVNNPCPTGYRLPTETELNAEQLSWSSNNAAGAFASQLKMPVAGQRHHSDGVLGFVGSYGRYHSSTVSNPYSRCLGFNNTSTNFYLSSRANGISVRCIKDIPPPAQPSQINGSTNPCENATGLIYNVTQEAGVTYTWTVPSGWSITAGQGTYEITVTAGTAAGTIEVTPSNAGGNGPSQTLAVVIQTVPLTPTNGTHVPDTDEIEWHWNTVSGASGYKWNTTNDYASAVDMGTYVTHTETGLVCAPCGGISYTRYVWAYNTCGGSTALTISASTTTCPTAVVDVTNPTTGKTWMDRNLGAAQVASSSTDSLAYGDLYQWGRLADGHQCRTSATTTTLSTSDVPGHGNFIIGSDWRSPKNDNLWQGVNGVNNPCPSGYRVPTETELEAERLSWSINNYAGAFASPLKLSLAGGKSFIDGSLTGVSVTGYYYSSTANGTNSVYLVFGNGLGNIGWYKRAYGFSVRCIKDVTLPAPPAQPSLINGSTIPCENTTGLIYNVTNEPGVTYIWTVPVGWNITAGQGTNEVTITAGTAAGDIEVTPSNVGGNGPSRTLAVTTQVCSAAYPPGTVHCDPANPTAVVDVTNPTTGKIWMDRNLGAAQVATSITDSNAYGDLYQWGRLADGHQCRTSPTTATISTSDVPGHGSFITSSGDWRSPQNASLWQGVNGVNNPCPAGYRMPTEAELNAERLSWGSQNNAAGAFTSQLKLPMAGSRSNSNGSIYDVGSYGNYYSSTPSGANSWSLRFNSTNAVMNFSLRAYGFSVRCIKNY